MRISQRLIVTLAATAISLGLPAGAGAAYCRAPPGQGAVDQYCEVIPAAGGNIPADPQAKGGADLSRSTLAALRRAGPDGLAIIAVAEDSGAPRSGREKGSATRVGAASPPSGLVGAAVASFSQVATGRSWLLWALLAVTASAIAGAIVRSRNGNAR